MSKSFDVYVEQGKKRLGYLADYKEICKKVKNVVESVYPEAKVYVFGSVVGGKATVSSDMDVLIVNETISEDKNDEIRIGVFKKLAFDTLIQLHFATKKQFSDWYLKFIDKFEEI